MYVGSEDSEALEELRYDVKAHPIAYIGLGQSSIFLVINLPYPYNILKYGFKCKNNNITLRFS